MTNTTGAGVLEAILRAVKNMLAARRGTGLASTASGDAARVAEKLKDVKPEATEGHGVAVAAAEPPPGPVGTKDNPMPVDLKTEEVTRIFLTQGQLCQKIVRVNARRALGGEKIVTKLQNGQVESTKIAEEGELIIQNPTGEFYIPPGGEAAFLKRNTILPDQDTSPGQTFVCQAKGMSVIIPSSALKDSAGNHVVINAPWNAPQYGGPDCYYAATCNVIPDPEEEGKVVFQFSFDDRYILGYDERHATYGDALNKADDPAATNGRLEAARATN